MALVDILKDNHIFLFNYSCCCNRNFCDLVLKNQLLR